VEQQTVLPDVSPGSSPAPVRADAVLDSLNHEERTSWQKTGEFPDRVKVNTPKSDVPAASSAAPPDVPAASSAATSDDSPASSADPVKKDGHKGNADTRLQELLREQKDWQRREAALLKALEGRSERRPPDAPASAAPTKAEWERFAAMADAPQEEAFATLRDYTIAMSLFVSDKRDGERAAHARSEHAISRHNDTVRKTVADAAARIETFRATDPDLESKIDPGLVEIVPASLVPRNQPIQPHHALMEQVLRSDFTPQLLIHFSTVEGKAEWKALCQLGSRPDAFLRAFGRLETRFEAAPEASPTKQTSSAPKPPTVLGSRTAETVDPVESAIKSKDPTAYFREANKRELAGLRR